jgi:protein-disulfide isomerase
MRAGDKNTIRVLLVAIFILLGVVGYVVGIDRVRPAPPNANEGTNDDLSVRPVSSEDHILGDIDARIKLIVFTDLECPYCKSFHQRTQPALISEYGDDIAIILRHYPLPSRPKALPEAEAAECAAVLGGEHAFWGFINAVFAVTPSNNGLDLNQLPDIALRLGLDVDAFTQCQTDGRGEERVRKDVIDGAFAGINLTPSILVVGETRSMLVAGDRPAALRSAIEYVRAQ